MIYITVALSLDLSQKAEKRFLLWHFQLSFAKTGYWQTHDLEKTNSIEILIVSLFRPDI